MQALTHHHPTHPIHTRANPTTPPFHPCRSGEFGGSETGSAIFARAGSDQIIPQEPPPSELPASDQLPQEQPHSYDDVPGGSVFGRGQSTHLGSDAGGLDLMGELSQRAFDDSSRFTGQVRGLGYIVGRSYAVPILLFNWIHLCYNCPYHITIAHIHIHTGWSALMLCPPGSCCAVLPNHHHHHHD